jgi:hypothetical protein
MHHLEKLGSSDTRLGDFMASFSHYTPINSSAELFASASQSDALMQMGTELLKELELKGGDKCGKSDGECEFLVYSTDTSTRSSPNHQHI